MDFCDSHRLTIVPFNLANANTTVNKPITIACKAHVTRSTSAPAMYKCTQTIIARTRPSCKKGKLLIYIFFSFFKRSFMSIPNQNIKFSFGYVFNRFQRFRATEECNADFCSFAGQRTTHFHCIRDSCNYTFKNKAEMGKHFNSIDLVMQLFL